MCIGVYSAACEPATYEICGTWKRETDEREDIRPHKYRRAIPVKIFAYRQPIPRCMEGRRLSWLKNSRVLLLHGRSQRSDLQLVNCISIFYGAIGIFRLAKQSICCTSCLEWSLQLRWSYATDTSRLNH